MATIKRFHTNHRIYTFLLMYGFISIEEQHKKRRWKSTTHWAKLDMYSIGSSHSKSFVDINRLSNAYGDGPLNLLKAISVKKSSKELLFENFCGKLNLHNKNEVKIQKMFGSNIKLHYTIETIVQRVRKFVIWHFYNKFRLILKRLAYLIALYKIYKH